MAPLHKTDAYSVCSCDEAVKPAANTASLRRSTSTHINWDTKTFKIGVLDVCVNRRPLERIGWWRVKSCVAKRIFKPKPSVETKRKNWCEGCAKRNGGGCVAVSSAGSTIMMKLIRCRRVSSWLDLMKFLILLNLEIYSIKIVIEYDIRQVQAEWIMTKDHIKPYSYIKLSGIIWYKPITLHKLSWDKILYPTRPCSHFSFNIMDFRQ